MNKTLTYSIGILLAAAVLAVAGYLMAFHSAPERAYAAVLDGNNIGDVATTSAATSITTSARIMATTSNPLGTPGTTSFNRVYAVVCNPNANPVWLNLDGDKSANLSTGNVTTVIAAAAGYNACYTIDARTNGYNGSVTASSTNQTATTNTVKQYVQ